jgi:Flp pilus assembly protein TadB
MDQNQSNTKTTAIVAGVVLFAFLVVFLFLWKVAGPVVAVIIMVFIFLFTGARLLRWSMQKKKRQAALANLRPDAVLIEGKSPPA